MYGGIFVLEQTEKGKHHLRLEQREAIYLTGVTDVKCFDENQVEFKTVSGNLTIRGKNLHVSRLELEKGEVDLTGKADSLVYTDGAAGNKDSFLGRLFR